MHPFAQLFLENSEKNVNNEIQDLLNESISDTKRDVYISTVSRNELKEWIQLFLRRTIEYIGFGEIGDRYERRRLLCVKMCEAMIKLNIKWINDSIYPAANAVLSVGRGKAIFNERIIPPINCPIDQTIKQELETVNVKKINFLSFLREARDSIPIYNFSTTESYSSDYSDHSNE